ncbi:MAG: BFD-like (2Fe-2S) protein [Desulfuromonas sp.]|nr:MAG: BFD-like (2Fe-2S) protein [Desulfuromonas sp.]
MVMKTICYCCNFTEEDIRQDVRQHNGLSSILERIVSEKEKGACRCDVMHPEGR